MPITEQEAILWGGNATADQLSAIPEPRIGRSQGLKMLEFSTAVIHSFYGGPAPPLFPFPAQEHIRLELESWCRKVLEWNDQRRQSVESDPKTFFYKEKRQDEAFLKTFGYPSNITSPTFVLLRVMFNSNLSSKMHAYITEAVRIMMMYGRSRSSFLPFLWVGLRDWETSSAWTRGKVLLLAIKYREAVKQAAEHHEQIKMNQLLMSMGLEPNAPLHSLAHFPSLTARQAQRSGVSEVVLRRRWE